MQENDVRVSPEADDDVVVAHAAFDDPRDLDQELGADQVSVRVVDALEVVEVEEEKTKASLLPAAVVDLPVEHQVQVANVEEVGEIVEVRQVLDLGEAAQVAQRQPKVAREVICCRARSVRHRTPEEKNHEAVGGVGVARGQHQRRLIGSRYFLEGKRTGRLRIERAAHRGLVLSLGPAVDAVPPLHPKFSRALADEQQNRLGQRHLRERAAGSRQQPLFVEGGCDALPCLQKLYVSPQLLVFAQKLPCGEGSHHRVL